MSQSCVLTKCYSINPLVLTYGEQRRLELPRRCREVQRRLRAVLLRRERDVELLAERTVRLRVTHLAHSHRRK